MIERIEREYQYSSPLSLVFNEYVSEKRACGVLFNGEAKRLHLFDLFCIQFNFETNTLPKEIIEAWVKLKPNESPNNHVQRIRFTNRLCNFMQRKEYTVAVCQPNLKLKVYNTFVPYIFTKEQIAELFKQAEMIKRHILSPNRREMVSVMMKLLYSTGMRVNEVLQLQTKDINFSNGTICIRNAKNRNERVVPLSDSMLIVLTEHFKVFLANASIDSYLFTTKHNKPYSMTRFYYIFRDLLTMAKIPHGGKGKGPRIHDVRHTFAVHSLASFCESNADIDAVLIHIATYLGHKNVSCCQTYLHLAKYMFPSVTKLLESEFSDIIPKMEVLNDESN